MSRLPAKFRKLRNIKEKDLKIKPEQAWITFCVCGVTETSCGWTGWILEDLFVERRAGKRSLSIDSRCRCPECNNLLFRTWVSILFSATDQRKMVKGKPTGGRKLLKSP